MEKLIGKVMEVFIPTRDGKDNLLDIMSSKEIGFKIKVNNQIITIIQEQNEKNAMICRDDEVLVIKQVISGKEFIDIELYRETFYGE